MALGLLPLTDVDAEAWELCLQSERSNSLEEPLLSIDFGSTTEGNGNSRNYLTISEGLRSVIKFVKDQVREFQLFI